MESSVVKARNIYLKRSLIRDLIRLRLQFGNSNSIRDIIAARTTRTTTTSRRSLSTTTGHPSSGQQNPRINNSNIKSSVQETSTRNTQSYRNYSTLNNSNSSKKNTGDNNNNKKKNQSPAGNDKTKMKVLAKNVLAAVFFTSLLVEESYMVKRGKGVLRYDVAQLPSNSPIEDARSELIIQVPIESLEKEPLVSDWLFFGVFDGHAGYNTSAKLKNELIGRIVGELMEVYKVDEKTELRIIPDSNSVDQAIRSGFLKLDDEIVNKSVEKLLASSKVDKAQVSELLMPLLSGSCALLSFYDTYSKTLKVAVTGDSRALLGSLNSDNEWTVEQLSIDQTGSNPAEVARMIREHPNEPDVVKRGRILGSLEPSRAFGDARYKWSQKIQDKIYKQFFGRHVPPNLLSPPYVTADPVITTTKIDPTTDKFLVLASDGLYEMLTNEEVVGLVVRWMENEKMVSQNSYNLKPFLKYFSIGGNDRKLPKVLDVTDTPKEFSKQASRKTNTEDVSYLLEDSNVSTHLIRNALSNGGSKEHSEMLASIPSPLSRRYRDDLTVTVVFFGDDGEPNDLGQLEMNLNATNEKGGNVEPKLKL